MDVDILVLWWYLRRRQRKTRKRVVRRHWMQPIMRERCAFATFETLIGGLRSDETQFFDYFRMSISCFDVLLARLSKDVTVRDTTIRECICAEQRLAICLRYYVSGCPFKQLHLAFRVGTSSISRIVKDMSYIIWNNLSKDFLKLPNTETEWEDIAERFKNRSDFPHCIGAVGVKHIRIVKPSKRKKHSTPRDHKGYLCLLGIVDSDYRFLYMTVGPNEEDGDVDVLKSSTFFQKANDGSLNIPKPRPPHEKFHEDLPFVLVADEGFATTPILLRPYGGLLDDKKRTFNYRLERAFRHIECALNILTNDWTILQRAMLLIFK